MTQQTTTKYRIRNWREYNKALVQRGSVTIWLSPEAVESWLAGRRKIREAALNCIQMKRSFVH